MKIVSKLLPALMAAVLVVSFADGASTTKRLPEGVQAPVPVAEEGQTSPPRAPRQFFPEKRIQPLTPEIEQSLIPKDSFKECDVCPEMVVVDSYAPNPFGLYQVHGNVFEWTEDCFNKRYNEDTPVDGSPWLEGDCHKRMLRGGTWDWSANMVRSSYRENAIVDGGGHSFRVVRTLNVPVQ